MILNRNLRGQNCFAPPPPSNPQTVPTPLPCNDFVIHLFCVCKKMTLKREHFWDFISRNCDLEIELFNKSDDDFSSLC